MSSPRESSNKGGGGNSGLSPYSSDLVKEMREVNAGLTPAGQKSRRGLGRGSASRDPLLPGSGSGFAGQSFNPVWGGTFVSLQLHQT
jgi:hypothetical protein